jgi:hypothetical protein
MRAALPAAGESRLCIKQREQPFLLAAIQVVLREFEIGFLRWFSWHEVKMNTLTLVGSGSVRFPEGLIARFSAPK